MPAFTEEEERNPTEEFIAYKFKTQWCPIGGPHDWENCVYAHTCRDLRRSPEIGYSSWPCQSWAESVASGSPEVSYKARCELGVACPHAHGAKEQLYHPLFYKTGPCIDKGCKRGVFCAFTHGDHEARAKTPSERPTTSSTAAPLPDAEAELLRHQPSFWKPPQYHAFEDQGGARAAAPRRPGGGGRAAPPQAPPQGQQPMDGHGGRRTARRAR
ncbi:unnamed protein product [Prorocentrum cordatum]|uniref:AtC3H23-like CCCH zinc finger domain-containing protein n=1 Tax=Prorocentrum cordatum TaxID=2364126 RepID=A0ABN9WQQ6_9DINO|nr:unnamed protein product [Polarella glacialis]